MLVVTVALAGKHYIVAQIEGVGSNLVYAGLRHSTNSFRLTLSDEISLGDMEAVKTQVPEVTVAAGATDTCTISKVLCYPDSDSFERTLRSEPNHCSKFVVEIGSERRGTRINGSNLKRWI